MNELTKLAVAYSSGDSSVEEDLFFQTRRIAFSVGLKQLKSRDAAEDIAQEVSLKVFFAYKNNNGVFFDADFGKSYSSWVGCIAYNAVINYVRNNRRLSFLDDLGDVGEFILNSLEDNSAKPDQDLECRELESVIDEAIDTLNANYKRAFSLSVMSGLTYNTVSEITGVPIGTVRSRVHRAREKIKEYVEGASTA